ncbi:MCE family protein [Nocardioides sp. NPDC127514]|uniref:MCE family protein n=1 Tax=unclassified Nocardioides TaxID=2615069 RepID=UPI0033194C82
MSRLTRVQLVAFAVVSAVAIVYGAIAFFDAGRLVARPYQVSAQFTGSGGIYPRANVELLGTRIGQVKELRPGPGTGTTVVLELDREVRVPRSVRARIGVKSAIGEQYVELTPTRSGGPYLLSGSVIPTSATQTPVETAALLKHVSDLAGSIDAKNLGVVLEELAVGLEGTAPALESAVDDSAKISEVALDDVEEINSLIDNAHTVLGTQAELAPYTSTVLEHVASLLAQLAELNPELGDVLTQGVRAGTEMNGLLGANSSAISLLLDDALHLTQTVDDRRPALRKSLVMLPWIEELVPAVFRYCDEIDPETGEKIPESCHYDSQGRPLWSTYIGMQVPPEIPLAQSYFPCTQGYEKTKRYRADGKPIDGDGPDQPKGAEPNMDAHCTSAPADKVQPNVRGSQNVDIPQTPRLAPSIGSGTGSGSGSAVSLYDPNTHTVATPDGNLRLNKSAPPADGTDADRLSWLLTGALRGER